jgi:translocation and assembly module TamA
VLEPAVPDGKGETAPAAASLEPEIPLYEFEVEAPPPLRRLLLDYLDLSRFRSAPSSERITGAELDRLAAAAPAQARSLLETEGYFDAEVKVTQERNDAGLARLTMTVVPGPRVLVKSVGIDATAPLPPRQATREEPWSDRLERIARPGCCSQGSPSSNRRGPAPRTPASAPFAATATRRRNGSPRGPASTPWRSRQRCR